VVFEHAQKFLQFKWNIKISDTLKNREKTNIGTDEPGVVPYGVVRRAFLL